MNRFQPGNRGSRSILGIPACFLALLLSGCAGTPPAQRAAGPARPARGYTETGLASWYGKAYNKRQTASGEAYDMYAMTAAHKTLPLGSVVRVKNLDNGKKVSVRINDRGPYVTGRIIDLSRSAARKLGMRDNGTARVLIELLR